MVPITRFRDDRDLVTQSAMVAFAQTKLAAISAALRGDGPVCA